MENNNNNKIALIVSGGLGDNLTYAARLQSLLNKENANKADIYLINTYIGVTYMIIEFLERSPIIDKVCLNRLPALNDDYKRIIDWREDDSPLPYPIYKDYKFSYNDKDIKWSLSILEGISNPIIMYPYTLGGSSWSKSEKYVRSPKEDWWKQLFKDIKKLGGSPIVIGGEEEYIDWNTDDVIPAYTDKDSFFHCIPLILNSKGYIGIASWPFMVAHYAGNIDTCVIWLYNFMWQHRHLTENRDKLNLFFEVPSNEEIINTIKVLSKK